MEVRENNLPIKFAEFEMGPAGRRVALRVDRIDSIERIENTTIEGTTYAQSVITTANGEQFCVLHGVKEVLDLMNQSTLVW